MGKKRVYIPPELMLRSQRDNSGPLSHRPFTGITVEKNTPSKAAENIAEMQATPTRRRIVTPKAPSAPKKASGDTVDINKIYRDIKSGFYKDKPYVLRNMLRDPSIRQGIDNLERRNKTGLYARESNTVKTRRGPSAVKQRRAISRSDPLYESKMAARRAARVGRSRRAIVGFSISGGANIKRYIKKAEDNVNAQHVDVGFFPGYIYEGGTSVATVAFKNDQGVGRPKRPFFTSSLPLLVDAARGYLPVIFSQSNGQLTKAALNPMGVAMAHIIQRAIINWKNPPNAPYTIARKGFNNPLVETLLMKASVKHRTV